MTRLLVADVAAALGIQQATWRAYVSRGKAPAPDGRFGREPWWKSTTIEAWQTSRPRAGAAGRLHAVIRRANMRDYLDQVDQDEKETP